VLDPPTADEMKVVKDLVSGVVGLDTARGDLLVVQTFPFDVTLASEPPADLIPPPPAKPGAPPPAAPIEPLWKQRKIQIIAGASAAVALLLVGLAVFLLKTRKKKRITAETATPGIEGDAAHGAAAKQIPAPDSVEAQKTEADAAALAELQAREVLGAIKLPDSTTKKGEVLKRHIREEIRKSPEAITHILRTWLNSSE
jgi:flagellar biosynthesis/type III secretory pathway M-ring protein FliF/YscJ